MDGFLTLHPWISWPKGLQIVRAEVMYLVFLLQKLPKKHVLPLLHLPVLGLLGFFPYVFSIPSKLHPLPIAIYILLHLQSVSIWCSHSCTHRLTVLLWGQELSEALVAILWLDRLNWTGKMLGSVGKFHIAVFEWVKLPKSRFPHLWSRKRFMLLITRLNFYI